MKIINYDTAASLDLEEEALISDADVYGWLIVVLRVEDALIVLCLYTDLWEREVVDTCCHNLAVGPLGGGVVYR